MVDDLVGIIKVKKYNRQRDGDQFRQPEVLGESRDNVQLYSEDNTGPLNGRPTETYTVFNIRRVAAENDKYVPKVQLIFGTGNFKIVDSVSHDKIVIMVESDYYVLSFPTTTRIAKVFNHFREIAESTIPMPPEVEFYLASPAKPVRKSFF